MSDVSACTYDVDVQDIHDEDAARRLIATIRKRVQEGRAQKPDAAHYVTVLAGHLLDPGVRDVLLAGLSQDENIDSIAFEAGTVNDLPPAWMAVAEAADLDAPLSGRVIAAGVDGIRVDVGGAIGTLRVDGRAAPFLGEHVKVRVLVLNLAQRRLELILAT